MFLQEIYLNLNLQTLQLNKIQVTVVLLWLWTIQVLVKSGVTTNVSSTQFVGKLKKMPNEPLEAIVKVEEALMVPVETSLEVTIGEVTEDLEVIIEMEALVAENELNHHNLRKLN